jgi:hypothetical protein
LRERQPKFDHLTIVPGIIVGKAYHDETGGERMLKVD